MLFSLNAVTDVVGDRDGGGARGKAGQGPLLHAVLHLAALGLLPHHRPVDLLAVGAPHVVGGLVCNSMVILVIWGPKTCHNIV